MKHFHSGFDLFTKRLQDSILYHASIVCHAVSDRYLHPLVDCCVWSIDKNTYTARQLKLRCSHRFRFRFVSSQYYIYRIQYIYAVHVNNTQYT